jgi:hypothetical protein
MTASPQKKAIATPAAASINAPAKAPAQPALLAYHVIPVPQGKPPLLSLIGAAVAHDDGEGFTLELDLVPTKGGRIVLRTPKSMKAANKGPAAEQTV